MENKSMNFFKSFGMATIVSLALVACGQRDEPSAPKSEQSIPPPATVQTSSESVSRATTPAGSSPASTVASSSGPTSTNPAASRASLVALTHDDMTRGLREALAQGVQHAIAALGQQDGFLNNLEVKIPVPESLARVEKTLRAVKQDKLADEFVATMNHAAEKAVPEGAAIFGEAITQMTLEDAQSILTGPNDAATQYFKKTSQAKLTEKFLPIVKTATEQAGVTSTYKRFMQEAGPAFQFLNPQDVDL